jgi:hypothetical protein
VTHRITVRSNPRLLAVPLVVLGLVGLAVALLTASPVLGVIALALVGYITYILIRFIRKQLRCSVEVVEDGVSLDLYGEEKLHMTWEEMSHRGTATDAKRRRTLFLYREDADKLLIVPDEFERFDALLAEVGRHGGMLDFALEEGETVQDRLRQIVGGPRVPVEDGDRDEPDDEATLPRP